MKNKLNPALAAILFAVAMAPGTLIAADIEGRMVDPEGQPIAGVQISVENLEGVPMGQAVSDAQGNYAVRNLAEGAYNLVASGRSAVTYVGRDGVTVDWGVSKTTAPIAVARIGTSTTRTTGANNSHAPSAHDSR
ncbi:MAG TPA: carboxypeptidase-like regulatory domain-containing protein [Candidatus Binataceae bacterium]